MPPETAGTGMEPGVVVLAGLVVVQAIPEAKPTKRPRRTAADARIVVFTLST